MSLPYGWGHNVDGVRLSVAREHAGVNNNLLAPGHLVDEISGTPSSTASRSRSSRHDRRRRRPDPDRPGLPPLRHRRPDALRGVCPRCRDELRAKFDIAPRDLVAAEYEPKRNVTLDAVATWDN